MTPGPDDDGGGEQALRAAYADLIEDEDVLRFLMQANCATDEPVIRDAVLACYARQVTLVRERVGGDEPALRRWFAAGMLDNVVAVLGLDAVDEPWAVTLRGPDRRDRPPSH